MNSTMHMLYQQLNDGVLEDIASALSGVLMADEDPQEFMMEWNDFYITEIMDPIAIKRNMARVNLIKHELLRRVWKPQSTMSRIDSNISTSNPMLRTMLRTRKFEEELIRNVWNFEDGELFYRG